MIKKAAIIAYTSEGCLTARRVKALLPDCETQIFSTEKHASDGVRTIPAESGFMRSLFETCDALVFVCAAGIAVRKIAPYVKDKKTDPAVIVIDEKGKYVISLLSGHIGGANRLAAKLAAGLGAQAVITTATDINGRFSVDEWASEHGLIIDDMKMAKKISAEILEHDISVECDFPVNGSLAAGLTTERTETGIYIGYYDKKPFKNTLRLITRGLSVGIGCRRGASRDAIKSAVEEVFGERGLDMRAISHIASIDLKSQEKGLLDFCEEIGVTPEFYSAEALAAVAGSTSSSDFVKSVTGVDNVCERAALCVGDELIVPKTASGGVTIAVAAVITEVCFE